MSDLDVPRQSMTRDELCRLLKVSPGWLDRNIARLRRDEGFPTPLLNRNYDPAAIAAWQNRRAGLANAVRPDTGGAEAANDDEAAILAADRARMDARALGQARR